MAALTEQALRVLDLSQELDVPLLDQIVTCFYTSVGREVFLYYRYGVLYSIHLVAHTLFILCSKLLQSCTSTFNF